MVLYLGEKLIIFGGQFTKGAGQIRNGHDQLFFQKIFTPQFFSMWVQMGLIFIPQKDFWPFSHFWHFLAILKNLEKN